MSEHCWQQLSIEKTKDLQQINTAYRQKLPLFHPETDPQGFKALRQAYEQARSYAEKIDNESPEPSPEQTQSNVDDPEQIAVESLLEQYKQLLADPQRCYLIDEWQHFIHDINQHTFAVIDNIRWPLLHISYHSDDLSNDCVALLADRLDWRQRLLELPAEHVQDIEQFLNYIARGDDFDLATMSQVSRAAQKTTASYIRTLTRLYWGYSFSELRDFLNQDTVIYWPEHSALNEQALFWYSHAGIGVDVLLQFSLDKLQQFADNPVWLYLTARQYTLLGDHKNAFDAWLKLYYAGEYIEDATEFLIGWCASYAPEYTPILIQAMNNSICLDSQIDDFSDPRHEYVIPDQAPETLLRFVKANQLALPPLLKSFVEWNLLEGKNYRSVLSLLLQDAGNDPLLRLYRHGVMLWLGNETLLKQIIDEPDRQHPLEQLILQGLKRQAQQQFDWLTHSPVVSCFTQWLYSKDSDAELPEIFTRDTHNLRFYLRNWLQRLRHVPECALTHLQKEPKIYAQDLGMFDWISHLSFSENIPFTAPPDTPDPQAYWNWYRSYLVLLVLVNAPEENFNYLHQENTLVIPQDHPIYDQFMAIKQIKLDEQLILSEQLLSVIPADSNLNWLILNKLTLLPERYITFYQMLDFAKVYALLETHWQQSIENSDLSYQLLLKGIFAKQECWQPSFSLEQQLQQFPIPDNAQTLNKLKTSLLAGKNNIALYFADTSNRPKEYGLLVRILNELNAHQNNLCNNKQIDKLNACLYTEALPFILRLCAGLLLSWHWQRQDRIDQAQEAQEPSPFWHIWSWNSRVDSLGFVAQLIICVIFSLFINVSLPLMLQLPMGTVWPENLAIFNFIAHSIIAIKRRCNDLTNNSTRLLLLMIVMPLLLPMLFVQGMPYGNRYGKKT